MPVIEPLRDLQGTILAAFANAPRPSGRAIAGHECPECEELRKELGRYEADEVPDSVIDYFGDSLSLLAPEGLRYYLPAYLLRATRDPGFERIDYLIFHLSPSAKNLEGQPDYWQPRLAIFSESERSAVLSFIGWLAQTETGLDYASDLERASVVWGVHA